jgi:hypothetical protein
MKCDLGAMWDEAVVVFTKALPSILLKGLRKPLHNAVGLCVQQGFKRCVFRMRVRR